MRSYAIDNCAFVWWHFIAHIVGTKGPYAKPGRRGKAFKLYKLALELFPHGPPSYKKSWVVGPSDAELFAKLLRGLFRRNDFS